MNKRYLILLPLVFLFLLVLISSNPVKASEERGYSNHGVDTNKLVLDEDLIEPDQCPSSMVGYWKNDGNAEDSVGTNNGTITNSNWSTDCINGSCMQSTPRGSTYISVPNSPSLNTFTDQLTVEAWVYPFASSYNDGQGNCAWVAMKTRSPGDQSQYGLCVGGLWAGLAEFHTTTQNGEAITRSTYNLAARLWYHLVGVYDGSNIRLYINGIENSTEAQSGSIVSGTGPLWMGRYCGGGSGIDQCYSGKIDEVAVYNRVLSLTEIQQHYQNSLNGQSYCEQVPTDTTPPTIVPTVTGTQGNNGWYTSDVTVSWAVSDPESGIVSSLGCDTTTLTADTSGDTLTCSATNGAENSNSASVTVKIDKTAPLIAWAGEINNGDSYYFGSVPPEPTCTASDSLSGVDGGCVVSGYATTVGSHILTATAEDNAGNQATENRNYTVLAWMLKGFYQPVDMNGVFNIAKNGSTVPLKFEIFAGATELIDIAYIKSLAIGLTACYVDAPSDAIELTATGNTSLRYDPIAGQFIYNWKTPSTPGKCYRVTMTTIDGSTLVAYFKLK